MKISSRSSKAFSLMEVLLAIFIFSAVMVGVTTYFASIVKANQNSKRLQQNLEDVLFAMNRIAKVLRTSTVLDPTAASPSSVNIIRVFDYSQRKCIKYEFDVTAGAMKEFIQVSDETTPTDGTEKTWCRDLLDDRFSPSENIVSVENGATLAGTFYVVPSIDTPPGSEVAGRATMKATITRNTTASTVQNTVSLRNYKEIHP